MKVKAMFLKPDKHGYFCILSHECIVNFDSRDEKRKFAQEAENWLERGGQVITQKQD